MADGRTREKQPLTTEQRELAGKHVGLAKKLAARRINPYVSPEDRLSHAYLGLIDAARTFDPARGLEFGTYAGYRIIGAMIDGERREASGTIRVGRKALGRGERGPSVVRFGRLEPGKMYEHTGSLVKEDSLIAPEPAVTLDDREAIDAALSSLNAQERKVASICLVEGRGGQAVAARATGLSESRVSQIIPGIVDRLRNHSALADYARGA